MSNTASLVFWLVVTVLLIVGAAYGETKSGENKQVIDDEYLNESL